MSARAAPVSDQRDRNAVQLAGDNAVVLEPGVAGLGKVAENHHVAPLHQEYAELPKIAPDPAKPFARMTETGQAETEGERFALDKGWLAAPRSDAFAGQLRGAGFKVKRTVLPGATEWSERTTYSFSTTLRGVRRLAVQVSDLACCSFVVWNESAHSNPEFDARLERASESSIPNTAVR